MLNLFAAWIHISLSVVQKRFLESEGVEKKNYVLPRNFQHMHQPKMFSGSVVFAHSLQYSLNLNGSGGEPPSVGDFMDILPK